MGRISSSIGLVTGIPIQDTVDQLIKLESRGRDLLAVRVQKMGIQQNAVAELSAHLLRFQFHVRTFKNSNVFDQLGVSSTNGAKLQATITGSPVVGSNQFTPIRQASLQQLLSSTFVSDDTPLGAGSFSYSYGGAVDEGTSLAALNGGQGIQRGNIRITDRSGASAEIDLRFVRTVDDVLKAVNTNSNINVTLETHGDQFRLVDHTGQTISNLRVQEINGGNTADTLGLAAIDVADTQADGSDVVSLAGTMKLADLNDGRGVRIHDALPELKVSFRDGSDELLLDFNRLVGDADNAEGTRIAANGETAQLRFRAVESGGDYDGYAISYVDDVAVTAGSETIEFDTNAKTLVFHIDEGSTTADHIIDALAAHSQAGAAFTASKTAGALLAKATTTATNGPTAELNFKATAGGPNFDGFAVSFVNDTISGSESADYDDVAKTIVFHIEEGVTTADDLLSVADANSALTDDFTVTTSTLFANATTSAVNGINAQLDFTSLNSGESFNDVTIEFVDNAGVSQGEETVAYDSTPGARKLTFQIDAGSTTANDIIAALAGDATAGALFSAAAVSGGTGEAVIDVTDTAVTDGGVADGLVTTSDSATTSGGTAGLISTSDGVMTYGGAATAVKTELTLDDLLDTINEVGAGRLSAELDADGLKITDLTQDLGGTFSISGAFDDKVLKDLGLNVAASGGVISGGRVFAGLKTTLLKSLAGGTGLSLGTIDLTDRAGQSTTVDLSTAETLQDVVDTINTEAALAGVAIVVEVNDSRKGLVVTDTSGSTVGPLIVANSNDGTDSADQLRIAVNDTVSSYRGVSLDLQTVTNATLLSDLNAGRGIKPGTFKIYNSNGLGTSVILTEETETVGELLELINDRTIDVVARINDQGDGIVLIDEAGGTETTRVTEINFGTTAADLHIVGDAKEVDINGTPTQIIEGGKRFEIELDDDDTLDDLIQKLNDSNGGIQANKFGDGSLGNPFRITIQGTQAGDANNVLFDTGGVDFSFQETGRAQDALLLFGSSESAGAGILVSSEDDFFDNILPGVRLQVKGSSETPITIRVSSSDTKVIEAAEDFVGSYNTLREALDLFTNFNAETGVSGVLAGSNETLRIDTETVNLLTGRFFGVGEFQSLESVGIGFKDDSTLELDSSKFTSVFNNDRAALEDFFLGETGVLKKMDALMDRLGGDENSLLVNRAKTIASKVNTAVARIEFMDARLEKRREQLLRQFIRMEEVIGKMQNDLAAINSLQIVKPLSFVSG